MRTSEIKFFTHLQIQEICKLSRKKAAPSLIELEPHPFITALPTDREGEATWTLKCRSGSNRCLGPGVGHTAGKYLLTVAEIWKELQLQDKALRVSINIVATY